MLNQCVTKVSPDQLILEALKPKRGKRPETVEVYSNHASLVLKSTGTNQRPRSASLPPYYTDEVFNFILTEANIRRIRGQHGRMRLRSKNDELVLKVSYDLRGPGKREQFTLSLNSDEVEMPVVGI